MTQTMPHGFTAVTKEEFFNALEKDGRDIMPSVQDPYQTTWETKNREVWGWSSGGWKSNVSINQKTYAIKSRGQ